MRPFIAALVLCGLLLSVSPAFAAGTLRRTYSHDYEAVWDAAIGALQARGDAVIHSEKSTGIITSDYKTERDDELRHKFNLLLERNGGATNVSVSCVIEEYDGEGAFTPAGWANAEADDSREMRLLDAIGRRLQPGGIAMDNADANCQSNLNIGGSMVRGSTYSTYVEFNGVTPSAAVDALISSLGKESLDVLEANKNAGAVSAGGGDSPAMDFTVSAIAGGARVKVVQKYGVGKRGNADAVSNQFCKIISGMTAAMPQLAKAPVSNPSAVRGPGGGLTIEERLKKLDDLLKKGLITEDEYKKKRAELLSSL